MSNYNENQEMLREMAKLAILGGKLNDIQIKNIQTFPFIYFNGVKEVNVDYDLDPGQSTVNYEIDSKNPNIKYDVQKPVNKTYINYKLTLWEESKNPQLEARFEALEKSISTLLWTGIKLKVFIDNQLAYETKNV